MEPCAKRIIKTMPRRCAVSRSRPPSRCASLLPQRVMHSRGDRRAGDVPRCCAHRRSRTASLMETETAEAADETFLDGQPRRTLPAHADVTLVTFTPVDVSMPVPLRAPRSSAVQCSSRTQSPQSLAASSSHAILNATDTTPSVTIAAAVVSPSVTHAHNFWTLLCSTLVPAHVASYLCLQDLFEFSLSCRAALRGMLRSPLMWRALAQERFDVNAANIEARFREPLRQYLMAMPRTYDSACGTETAPFSAISPSRMSQRPSRAVSGALSTSATAAAGADTLRQGTLVIASAVASASGSGTTAAGTGSATHPLHRLTLRGDGHPEAAERLTSPSKASSWANGARSQQSERPTATATHTHDCTDSAATADSEGSALASAGSPRAIPSSYRTLFWCRLFKWLHHHRVAQFVAEHVEPPTHTGLRAALNSAESQTTLTRAIHVLYQGGCAHAEHVNRLASLLQDRATLTLDTAPHSDVAGQADERRATAGSARQHACADLALAAVLSPDDDFLTARLAGLIHALENDGEVHPPAHTAPRTAAALVVDWSRGVNAACAARTATNPFALFAYLQRCLLVLEDDIPVSTADVRADENAPPIHSTTRAGMGVVRARLFVASAVLLFLQTYEDLHVTASHLLVRAAKALPRCGATGGVVERLLLQALSDWLSLPEPSAFASSSPSSVSTALPGTELGGYVELALNLVPTVVQREIEVACERWVSQWVLRRHVTLPEMLQALRPATCASPSSSSSLQDVDVDDDDDDTDTDTGGERLLCELFLSLHHRVLLLPQPAAPHHHHDTTAPATRSSSSSSSSAAQSVHTRLVTPPRVATFTPGPSPASSSWWGRWDSTLRYLLLTPFTRERAAALTVMAALYHRPLQAHVRLATHFSCGDEAEMTGDANADDAPPLPSETDGALVAMRLLHVACALDPGYAAAHTTLASLCLSLGDVSAARDVLSRFLASWATVPLTSPQADGDTTVTSRPAQRAERTPESCFIPAAVTELCGRCDARDGALHACKRWALEAARHNPRLSAPVRLRAATYMDLGLGLRADAELAALTRVTMRADDVALRLRFLLDTLQRGDVDVPAAGISVQWERVADLAGTLYALSVAEGQPGSRGVCAPMPPPSRRPLTGPYAELLVNAQHAYREYVHASYLHIPHGTATDTEDAGEACATRFLHTLLHGSLHEAYARDEVAWR